MSDYQQHLAKTIAGAENLICTVNTIGKAMDDGGSAAGDCVGAIRVLSEAVEAHTRDLKALQLCEGWEDTARRKKEFNLDGELLDARVLVERVRVLLRMVCEDYFNERTNNPATAKGQEGILGGFDENRVICWSANSCVVDLDKAIGNMTALMAAAKEEVKST